MKQLFRDKRFSQANQALLGSILGIIDEYQGQGIRLTLRQLYYQLVARDLIPNKVAAYHKLSTLLTNARYAGIVDWNAIEDRIRRPEMHGEWEDVADLVESAKQSYRLDRWEGQDYYIELFTEKDALSSVLAPIANKWHIHFCVNRGYTSASAMYGLYQRIQTKLEEQKEVVLLYLGDHDPSGLDMVRDMQERLVEMLSGGIRGGYAKGMGEWMIEDHDFSVKHIAITREQIEEYEPPPNPAKISDPRAHWYIAKHGKTSWEVDALRPEVMIKLVNDTIEKYVDMDKMDKVKEQEDKDMEQLEEFAKTLRDGEDIDEEE